MLSFKQFISEEIDLERRKESKNRARSAYMNRQAKPHPDILDHYNNWRASTPSEKEKSGIRTLNDYHTSIQNVPEGHPLHVHRIPIKDSYKRMDGVVPFGRAPKKEVTPRPPPFPHKEDWVKNALQRHDTTSRPTLEGYRVAMNSHEGNTNELEANKRDVLRAIKHHGIEWPKQDATAKAFQSDTGGQGETGVDDKTAKTPKPKTPKPQKEPRELLDRDSLAQEIAKKKLQGYSHRDIAKELKISAGTVSKIHNSKSSNV